MSNFDSMKGSKTDENFIRFDLCHEDGRKVNRFVTKDCFGCDPLNIEGYDGEFWTNEVGDATIPPLDLSEFECCNKKCVMPSNLECLKKRTFQFVYDNGITPGSSTNDCEERVDLIRFQWEFTSTTWDTCGTQIDGGPLGPFTGWGNQLTGWAEYGEENDPFGSTHTFDFFGPPTWRGWTVTGCHPDATYGTVEMVREDGCVFTLYPTLYSETIETICKSTVMDCDGNPTTQYYQPNEDGETYTQVEAPEDAENYISDCKEFDEVICEDAVSPCQSETYSGLCDRVENADDTLTDIPFVLVITRCEGEEPFRNIYTLDSYTNASDPDGLVPYEIIGDVFTCGTDIPFVEPDPEVEPEEQFIIPGCIVEPATFDPSEFNDQGITGVRICGVETPVELEAGWTGSDLVVAENVANPDCVLQTEKIPLNLLGLDDLNGGTVTSTQGSCPDGLVTTATLTATNGDNPLIEVGSAVNKVKVNYNGATGESTLVYEFNQPIDLCIQFSSNHERDEPLTLITPYDSIIPGPGSGFLSGSNTTGDPHVWHNENSSHSTGFTEFNWLQTQRVELGLKGDGKTQNQLPFVTNFYTCDPCGPLTISGPESPVSISGPVEVMYEGSDAWTQVSDGVPTPKKSVLIIKEGDTTTLMTPDCSSEVELEGSQQLHAGACPLTPQSQTQSQGPCSNFVSLGNMYQVIQAPGGTDDINELEGCQDTQIEWNHNGDNGQSDSSSCNNNCQYIENSKDLSLGDGLTEALDYSFTYVLNGASESTYLDAKSSNDYVQTSFTLNSTGILRNVGYGFFTNPGAPEGNVGNFKITTEISDDPNFATFEVINLDHQIVNMVDGGYLSDPVVDANYTLEADVEYYFRHYLYDSQNGQTTFDFFGNQIPLEDAVRFDDNFYPIVLPETCTGDLVWSDLLPDPTCENIPVIKCTDTGELRNAITDELLDSENISLEDICSESNGSDSDFENTHLIEGCDDNGDPAYTIVDDEGEPLFTPRPITDTGLADCCLECLSSPFCVRGFDYQDLDTWEQGSMEWVVNGNASVDQPSSQDNGQKGSWYSNLIANVNSNEGWTMTISSDVISSEQGDKPVFQFVGPCDSELTLVRNGGDTLVLTVSADGVITGTFEESGNDICSDCFPDCPVDNNDSGDENGGGSTEPTLPTAGRKLVSDNHQDGNGGASYNLQVRNASNAAVNWELLWTGRPYSTIPNLNLPTGVVHTFSQNASGAYDHLFSGQNLGAFSNVTITGAAPIPAGDGSLPQLFCEVA